MDEPRKCWTNHEVHEQIAKRARPPCALEPTPARKRRARARSQCANKAAAVFGRLGLKPKYRATCTPHGPRSFYAVVGRAQVICAYPGRSVGRSGRRISPVGRCSCTHQTANARCPVFFMNIFLSIRIFTDRPGHVGADHQHLNNTRQLPSTGRSMVGRCSTAKVDFGLLTPNFPLFMNKQRRLLCALRTAHACGSAVVPVQPQEESETDCDARAVRPLKTSAYQRQCTGSLRN